MNFGNILKKIRQDNNLTQEELAKKIDTSRSNIANYENNKNMPSVDILDKLSKMFYSKGYTDHREQCKIFDAIATITRISLGYNQVQIIPAEKAEDIRQIMYKVLNIFPNRKTN